MTDLTAPGPVAIRRRPPTSDLLRWVFGALLLFGVGYWLVESAIDEPQRFLQVSMIGLSNGMIFALVALGYTLVYGIIELINFAHGDIFMLGTLETQSIFADGSLQIPLLFFTISIPLGTAASVDVVRPREGIRNRSRAPGVDGVVPGDQRRDRAHRLQAASQPAPTGPADHGDRVFVHPPGRRARPGRERGGSRFLSSSPTPFSSVTAAR